MGGETRASISDIQIESPDGHRAVPDQPTLDEEHREGAQPFVDGQQAPYPVL